jgi:hypothetical protein
VKVVAADSEATNVVVRVPSLVRVARPDILGDPVEVSVPAPASAEDRVNAALPVDVSVPEPVRFTAPVAPWLADPDAVSVPVPVKAAAVLAAGFPLAANVPAPVSDVAAVRLGMPAEVREPAPERATAAAVADLPVTASVPEPERTTEPLTEAEPIEVRVPAPANATEPDVDKVPVDDSEPEPVSDTAPDADRVPVDVSVPAPVKSDVPVKSVTVAGCTTAYDADGVLRVEEIFVIVDVPRLPGTKTGTSYSSQEIVTSATWPVPVLKMQNGSGVAAGGMMSSSPSAKAQTTRELPGTQSRAEYPAGAVGVVPNVDQTSAVEAGSMGPTVLDRLRIVPAVAGVTAAAVATPSPMPKPVAVVLEMETWRIRQARPVPSAAACGTSCTNAPPEATTEVRTEQS